MNSGQAFILGVGMTSFGRHLDRSLGSLVRDATEGAIRDAGLALKDVQVAFFGNTSQGAIEGQHMIRGQLALRPIGLEGIPVINVENACASASTAFSLACSAVASSQYDVALAVGADKLVTADRAKGLGFFDSGLDVTKREETIARLLSLSEGFELPLDAAPEAENRSVFMDFYASFCRFHMKRFGTTQRQIAAVAAKNHQNSVHNSRAQYRHAMSIDEVLASKTVAWPLTVAMCSPVTDGAAAAIICSHSFLKRHGRSRAVPVLACTLGTGVERDPQDLESHVVRLTADRAYEAAGVSPSDVGVAELHDATAMAEIQQCEYLRLCEYGEGGPLAESGETSMNGRIPINPSGGLESKGHPIGATGLAQVFELVTQLRGEAGPRQVKQPQIGLAENGGGFYGVEEAIVSVTLLGASL